MDWYRRYNDMRVERQAVFDKRDELMVQIEMSRFRADFTYRLADEKLFKSGECEDRAQEANAEYAHIDNTSFEKLSSFEEQRQRVSEGWVSVDGIEQQVEFIRDEIGDQRGSGAASNSSRQGEIGDLERQAEAARSRLTEQVRRRDQLWDEVEQSWSQAFHANMARTEYLYHSRRERSGAEDLYSRAAAVRARVSRLNDELEATHARIDVLDAEIDAHIEKAREEFDCTLVEEFMFWPREDDVKMAICVPIVQEMDHLNVQVEPLKVYQVARSKGLEFVEPLPDEAGLGVEDERLEAFFSRDKGQMKIS